MYTINNKEVNVSTITICCKIPDCDLNLTNIGQYLAIDDQIIGIKYKYGTLNIMKGMYSTTSYKKSKGKKLDKINKKLFYNQISIIVHTGEKPINVKVFKNGSLHMTGCKSEMDAFKVVKILLAKFKILEQMPGHTVVLTQDEHGMLLDTNNLLYSQSEKQIIGYKVNTNSYIIDKKEYYVNDDKHILIYGKQESQRKKEVLNFNGENIGYTQLELLHNRTKFYKKHCNIHYDYSSGLIYANNNLIIGKIKFSYDTNQIVKPDKYMCVLEVNYKINPYKNKNADITLDYNTFKQVFDVNINCVNVYFNIGFKINRNKLYDYLINCSYLCKYRPESYSGIKLVYKLPILIDFINLVTLCHCTNKCYCRSLTFLIFQSGNVIATGFKSIEEVDKIVEHFLNVVCPLQTIIQQKQVMEN